jgi:hypothetical protein
MIADHLNGVQSDFERYCVVFTNGYTISETFTSMISDGVEGVTSYGHNYYAWQQKSKEGKTSTCSWCETARAIPSLGIASANMRI